jgi:hypothetical protein
MCLEVFPVVHEDWFLDEVRRVLAPGGVLVAVVSNRSSYRTWLWRARRRGTDRDDNELPMYSRTYSSWRRYLLDRGFAMVHEEGLCWMPFSRESNSRLIRPLTALERVVGLRMLVRVSPWICVVLQRPV